MRYFGPRALIEDNSVRSTPTTLLNFEGGYQFMTRQMNAQIYNLLDAEVSDVHPAVPRTLRVSMVVGF